MIAFSMKKMDENIYVRQFFKQRRATYFNQDIQKGMINSLCIPTFGVLKTSISFGIYELLMKQLVNHQLLSKSSGINWYGRLRGI